jgi:DNA-directed RNA polymerase specialized sigma24 family protein
VRAAQAAALSEFEAHRKARETGEDQPLWSEEARQEARKVALPRGRPERGRSTGWYAELLQDARELESQGKSAAQEIAKRKRVPVNTVYQWLFRARQLEERKRG